MVAGTDKETLHGFIADRVSLDAEVYTDDHQSYNGLPNKHKIVKHTVSQYVNGMAHTNGIESFWSLLKKGYHGTFHHFSPKHLDRYVNEFVTRHNIRQQDTIVVMGDTVGLMQSRPTSSRLAVKNIGAFTVIPAYISYPHKQGCYEVVKNYFS